MAPKNLLRHIFKHSAHSKSRAVASSQNLNKPLHDVKVSTPSKSPTASPPATTPPASPQPPTLGRVVAESDRDACSIAETLAALDLETHTFTTRDLLYTNIHEAIIATRSHLETIDTTLELLKALDGFSAAIPVLSAEMKDKKLDCEGKLRMFDDIIAMVDGMSFSDEDMATKHASGDETVY